MKVDLNEIEALVAKLVSYKGASYANTYMSVMIYSLMNNRHESAAKLWHDALVSCVEEAI